MSPRDAAIAVEVNPANPGEFLACCGLLELVDRLHSGADGCFVGQDGFCVSPWDTGVAITLTDILWALAGTGVNQGAAGKIAPLTLNDPVRMKLDWWLEASGKSGALKLWAGNQTSLQVFGKLAAALRDVLDRELSDQAVLRAVAPETGGLGFDAAIGWSSEDTGFSYNNPRAEGGRKREIRPAIEMLGLIGLQRFRPIVSERTFRYSTWDVPLSPSTARFAAFGSGHRTSVSWESRIQRRGAYKYLEFARMMSTSGGGLL